MSDVFSIVILVIGVCGLGVVFWAIRSGTSDRNAEDDARAFFAEHSRWPDESPQEADERRRRAAEAAAAPLVVSEPDDEGRV